MTNNIMTCADIRAAGLNWYSLVSSWAGKLPTAADNYQVFVIVIDGQAMLAEAFPETVNEINQLIDWLFTVEAAGNEVYFRSPLPYEVLAYETAWNLIEEGVY